MKKHVSLLLTLTLAVTAALAGCSGSRTGSQAPGAAESTTAAPSPEAGSTEGTEAASQESADSPDSPGNAGPVIRIGSLKGPTSMGLVHLMDLNEKGET